MKTIKKTYTTPDIIRIELDNEISLVLATGDAAPTINFADPGAGCASGEETQSWGSPYE